MGGALHGGHEKRLAAQKLKEKGERKEGGGLEETGGGDNGG